MRIDPPTFTDEEHEEHCRIAECGHVAIHFHLPDGTGIQGWCARCRAVAFGGVYEGMAVVNARIARVAQLN